jgi:O-antigen/teichoic acid export membrane protein
MISSNKKIDFILIAGSQFLVLIMSVWLMSFLTNNLSIEIYGYYVLFFTAAIFLRQLIYDPISYVVVRDCGQIVDVEDVHKKITAMSVINDHLIKLIGIGFLLIGIFVYAAFTEIIFILYVLIFYFYLFSNGGAGIALAVLNILRKRRFYGFVIVFDGVLKLFILYIFFEVFNVGFLQSVAALALTSLCLHISLRFYFKRTYFINKTVLVHDDKFVTSVYKNALPFYVPTFFVALKGVGERWVLAANVGVEDLAIFNVLFQLGFSPVVMIFGVLQTFVAPIIYKLAVAREGDQNDFGEFMFRLVGGLVVLGTLGFFLADIIGPVILKYIVPENYHSHLHLFPLFVVAGVLAAAVGIVHLGVVGAFEPKVAGKLMTTAMISGIFISLLAVWGWGFDGAIFGLIASNVIAFFIYFASLHKKLNNNL